MAAHCVNLSRVHVDFRLRENHFFHMLPHQLFCNDVARAR